jgi:hypothetical protein
MVAIGRSMPVVLDTYRFVTALKGTGKNANFTAEEIARAIDVSQQGSDVLTKSAFDVAMAGIDTRFARLEATLGTSDAKFETLRADIKAEVKSSQVQEPAVAVGYRAREQRRRHRLARAHCGSHLTRNA